MKHFNQTLNRAVNTTFKFKGGEVIPADVEDFIQPCVEVKPELDFFATAKAQATATTLVTTTAIDKDIVITQALLSYAKDAANDATEISLTGVVKGVTIQIARLALLAGVGRDSVVVNFDKPLVLDRNSTISMVFTYGAGLGCCACCLYGHNDG